MKMPLSLGSTWWEVSAIRFDSVTSKGKGTSKQKLKTPISFHQIVRLLFKPDSFVAQIPDFLPICPLHLFLLLSGPIMRDFVPISTDSVIIRDPSSSRPPPSCTAAVLEAKVSWHHRVHGWAAGQLNWTPIARWGRTHNPNSSNSIWYIWYGRYAAKTEMKGVVKADCRT